MCHYFRSRQYQTRPGLAGASTSPAVPHTTQLSSALPSCGGGATPTFCPNSNDTIEERIQSSCLQPLSKTRLPGGRQPSLEHILSQDFKWTGASGGVLRRRAGGPAGGQRGAGQQAQQQRTARAATLQRPAGQLPGELRNHRGTRAAPKQPLNCV